MEFSSGDPPVPRVHCPWAPPSSLSVKISQRYHQYHAARSERLRAPLVMMGMEGQGILKNTCRLLDHWSCNPLR
jgi:hypothetical protein